VVGQGQRSKFTGTVRLGLRLEARYGASAGGGIADKSSAVAEIGDRGHNRHGPIRGGAAVPLSRGRELGPRLKQRGLGQGLPPYQVASSSIEPFGHNRHEPKTGRLGAVPLL